MSSSMYSAGAVFLAASLAVGCGSAPPPAATSGEAERPETPVGRRTPPLEAPRETTIASSASSDWVVIGTPMKLALRLPSGWHRVDAETLSRSRRAHLRGGSAELAADVEHTGWRRSLQVAAMERDPVGAPGGVPIPTVQIMLRELPGPVTVERLCEMTTAALQQRLQDVRLVANEPAAVGPLEGGLCHVSYQLDTTDGPTPVEALTYFVIRDGVNLQISVSGPLGLDRAVVDALLTSIRGVD